MKKPQFFGADFYKINNFLAQKFENYVFLVRIFCPLYFLYAQKSGIFGHCALCTWTVYWVLHTNVFLSFFVWLATIFLMQSSTKCEENLLQWLVDFEKCATFFLVYWRWHTHVKRPTWPFSSKAIKRPNQSTTDGYYAHLSCSLWKIVKTRGDGVASKKKVNEWHASLLHTHWGWSASSVWF